MRTVLLAAVMLVSAAAPARAQVIEIADDGTAQVFSGNSNGSAAGHHAGVRRGLFDVNESLDRAAHDHGLDPGLLRAVAWQESRGSNTAVSDKGALGIMQLMPGTAAALGVDPGDPSANINGGAAYLALQMAKFGNVELALAAYNAGPGAVVRYGGVPPYRETRNYVSTIMQRWNGSVAALAPGHGARAASKPQSAPRDTARPTMLIEVETE